MRILDCKDCCNECNKSLTEKNFRELDKDLQNCSSFAKQKEMLISFYTEETFKRDKLLSRRFSLTNKMAFGVNERISWTKEITIAFIISTLTVYIDNWFNSDAEFSCIKIIGLVVLLAIPIISFIKTIFFVKHQDAKERIPMYEIMCLEKTMIEKGCKLALLNEGQEIDIKDLVETIIRAPDNS